MIKHISRDSFSKEESVESRVALRHEVNGLKSGDEIADNKGLGVSLMNLVEQTFYLLKTSPVSVSLSLFFGILLFFSGRGACYPRGRILSQDFKVIKPCWDLQMGYI